MIRLVAAGLVLAGALSALKGCPAEGDPGGVNNGPAGPAAGKVVRPISVLVSWKKDMDPPPGATACLLKWFNTTLMPGGYDHRQDGSCHAWGDVPNVETQG